MDEEETGLQTFDIFKENKGQRLSLYILVKRHLPQEAQQWDQEQILLALNELTHVRLDRENINHIDSLELLGDKVTNLYLQQNQICRIKNIGCLKNLKFLTLAGNQIERVENLNQLTKLLFLDLSDNSIEHLDTDEFPQSLALLNLSGNPCVRVRDYRANVIQDLPSLRQLDGVEVSRDEREEAGYRLSSAEEGDTDSQEEEESSPPRRGRMLREHELDVPFSSLTSEVLLRSQTRLEDKLVDHRRHNMELDNIRLKYRLPPSARDKPRKT